MRTIIVFIVFVQTLNALGQKRGSTQLGLAYTIETNVGFHGMTIGVNRTINLKPNLAILMGGHFFTSNNIPDRKEVDDQFNRSLIADACLQFSPKSTERGFFVNAGPTFRFSRTRVVSSYNLTPSGSISNVRYSETNSSGVGIKLGLGYKIPLSATLHSAVFIDCRIIDVLPEPTFLGAGYAIGF